jgi:RNA-directed DNA polymerase
MGRLQSEWRTASRHNLVLDELDRELERRGHRFVRYADDSNIYVRSERAGQSVMESITHFITHKLKLKVNESKSAVVRPEERKFLGFSFTVGPEAKRVIAPKALERFKQRIRRKAKGVSMKTTMEDWPRICADGAGYFGFCEMPEVLIALTAGSGCDCGPPSGGSGEHRGVGARN